MAINLPPFSTWTSLASTTLHQPQPWSSSCFSVQLSLSITEQEQHRQEFPAPGTCSSVLGLCLYPTLPLLIAAGKWSDSSYRGRWAKGGSLIRGRDKIILSLPLIILQTREKLQKWAFKSVCLFRMRKNPQTAVHSFLFKDWLKLSASQVH